MANCCTRYQDMKFLLACNVSLENGTTKPTLTFRQRKNYQSRWVILQNFLDFQLNYHCGKKSSGKKTVPCQIKNEKKFKLTLVLEKILSTITWVLIFEFDFSISIFLSLWSILIPLLQFQFYCFHSAIFKSYKVLNYSEK